MCQDGRITRRKDRRGARPTRLLLLLDLCPRGQKHWERVLTPERDDQHEKD